MQRISRPLAEAKRSLSGRCRRLRLRRRRRGVAAGPRWAEGLRPGAGHASSCPASIRRAQPRWSPKLRSPPTARSRSARPRRSTTSGWATTSRVLVGCGLGGTSLINANVALEADIRIFQSDGWPKALSEGPHTLDRFHARAKAMLGSTPYPEDFPQLRKLHGLAGVRRRLGPAVLSPAHQRDLQDRAERGRRATGSVHALRRLHHGVQLRREEHHADELPSRRLQPWRARSSRRQRSTTSSATANVWKVSWRRWRSCGDGRQDAGGPARRSSPTSSFSPPGPRLHRDPAALARARAAAPRRGSAEGFSGNGDVLGFAYDCDLGDGDAQAPARLCGSAPATSVRNSRTGRPFVRDPASPASSTCGQRSTSGTGS